MKGEGGGGGGESLRNCVPSRVRVPILSGIRGRDREKGKKTVSHCEFTTPRHNGDRTIAGPPDPASLTLAFVLIYPHAFITGILFTLFLYIGMRM